MKQIYMVNFDLRISRNLNATKDLTKRLRDKIEMPLLEMKELQCCILLETYKVLVKLNWRY